jgi:hypothetical protein
MAQTDGKLGVGETRRQSKLVVVRFLKKWKGYKVGEPAGFGTHRATSLVAEGLAEYDDPQMHAKQLKAKAEEADRRAQAAAADAKSAEEKAADVNDVKEKEATPAVDKQAKPAKTKGLFGKK